MTTKRSNTPIADFKFGDAQQGQPSSINGAIKLESYLVSYNDGQGKPQTRIVFRVPGTEGTFMLQERISGVNVATSAHEWFHKALVEKLQVKGLEGGKAEEAVESV